MKSKLFSKVLVSTCIVSLLSVPAFAKINSDQSFSSSAKSEDFVISPSHAKYLKENPEAKSIISGGFQKYTYENAPEDVKAQYDSDCKLINRTPRSSDTILVPTSTVKSSSSSSLQNNVIFYIFHNRSNGDIDIYGSDGSHYKANTSRDYVGYNYRTQGSAVYCTQIILNTLNYRLAVDGIFGSNTHNAVTNFQRAYGLQVDATVGPSTWNAMLRASGLY